MIPSLTALSLRSQPTGRNVWDHRHFLELEEVIEDGLNLEYTAEDIRDDRAIVLVAVAQNGEALQFASPRLKGDREFALTLIRESTRRNSGFEFRWLSPPLRGDREVVLAAVTSSGQNLQDVSVSMKDDEEVVRTATRQWGPAFQFASERLRGKKTFVLSLLQDSTISGFGVRRLLRHASEPLRDDREVVLAAVSKHGFNLEFASALKKDDEDIVQEARKSDPRALDNASSRLQEKLSLKRGRQG